MALAGRDSVTSVNPATTTGDVRCVRELSPNCPSAFKPHAQTVPSCFSARLCVPPAATATTLVIVGEPDRAQTRNACRVIADLTIEIASPRMHSAVGRTQRRVAPASRRVHDAGDRAGLNGQPR